MYLRTKRRLVAVCLCGLAVCIVLVIIMNVCEKSEKSNVEVSDSLLHQQNHKIYNFMTNLLVMVVSSPSHESVRQVVRETWAQQLPEEASVRFIVGSQGLSEDRQSALKQENDTSKDIIFLDEIQESYTGLTNKLLAMYKFANKFIKFNFLLKVDEDSFVRVNAILEALLEKPQDRLYWGFFDGRAHVKKAGKWQEGEYVLCDRYIPYALGGGYLISKDLVGFLADNSDMLQVYKSEDVSLGTWLAPLNIHRIHDPNFDTEYKSRGCFNSYLVTHKKTPEEMKVLQQNLDKSGKLCTKEHRVRLSYNYDWSNPPTQCCERKDPNVP